MGILLHSGCKTWRNRILGCTYYNLCSSSRLSKRSFALLLVVTGLWVVVVQLHSITTVLFHDPLSHTRVGTGSRHHSKWIVLDVTSGTCSRQLVVPPSGWKLMMVGGVTSACNPPDCRVASLVQCHDSVNRLMCAVNSAYMEVISLGAEQVLVVDCSTAVGSLEQIVNVLTPPPGNADSDNKGAASNHDSPQPSHRKHGLMYNNTLLFNVYAHFGAVDAIPRAFLTSENPVLSNSGRYYLRDFDRVLVKHAVSDDSKDLMRLREHNGSRVKDYHAKLKFEPWAPPVFVGKNCFSPAVPVSSLYSDSGLWFMALPCLKPRWRCEILRQMIGQRLMRELDAFAAFVRIPSLGDDQHTRPQDHKRNEGNGAPPKTRFLRDEQVNTAADSISITMYIDHTNESAASEFDIANLASFLDKWVCQLPNSTFYQCYTKLAHQLHVEGFVNDRARTALEHWIKVLQKLGVREPARVLSPWTGVKKVGEVLVVLGTSASATLKAEEERLQTHFIDVLKNRCDGYNGRHNRKNSTKHRNISRSSKANKSSLSLSDNTVSNNTTPMDSPFFLASAWTRPVLPDIVLVVVFNINTFLFSNLPYLETIHRPYFKHIFYCVPDVDDILKQIGDDVYHVNFVEGMSDSWLLLHECVTSVSRIGLQGVSGYLHIGEDTLINSWKLEEAPRDKLMLQRGEGAFFNGHMMKCKDYYWSYWAHHTGRPPLLKLMANLQRISGMEASKLREIYRGTTTSSSAIMSSPLSSLFQNLSSPCFMHTVSFTASYRQWLAASPLTAGWKGFIDMEQQMENETNNDRHKLFPGTENWEKPSPDEAERFLRHYVGLNKLGFFFRHLAIDFFYLPQQKVREFALFSRYFISHHVMDELAVPAIVDGISAPADRVDDIPAKSLWGSSRVAPQKSYNKTDLYLHPFKIKINLEDDDGTQFYCQTFLRDLTEAWEHSQRKLRNHGNQ